MRYLIAVLAACGATPGSTTTPPGGQPKDIPAPTAPAPAFDPFADFAWWIGDWTSGDGEEHWVLAGGALYGVSFSASGQWEAMIVDDHDENGKSDAVRLIAMPGGSKSVEFIAEKVNLRNILFAAPQHDDPKMISYAGTGDTLRATVHLRSQRSITFDFTRTDLPRAPELEQADIAFSERVQKGGIDAWMAAFDANGGMIRKNQRITGDAIREMMAPVLGAGSLIWTPIDSGKRGDLGFTVGTANFVGAKSKTIEWRSSYVTIWKQQPDKSWKVLFDTGRPIFEPLPARSEPAN
jgi:ketosteroid isomerase-like protein